MNGREIIKEHIYTVQLGWAGTSDTCEMEGRPKMPSGGDKLMADSGFSKFKVNIWSWQLAAKWAYMGANRPMHLYFLRVYITTVNGEM